MILSLFKHAVPAKKYYKHTSITKIVAGMKTHTQLACGATGSYDKNNVSGRSGIQPTSKI